MNRHAAAAAAAFSALLLAAVPASAEVRRTVTVGAGAQVLPKFQGSDDYGFAPLPFFDLRPVGEPLRFGASDESFGLRLFGERMGFSFGPVIGVAGKREEDDVGAPVGDVDFTIEPGAYAQAWLGRSIRLRGEVRRGIGGHDGWLGDLGADFVLRSDGTVGGIGPRLRWADGAYHEAYFGVSPAAAAASGLAAFDPGGGIYAVGAIAGIGHQFDERWGLYAYAGYDRLVGDAADSPIVRQLGSRDQFSAGLALTYSFDMNLPF